MVRLDNHVVGWRKQFRCRTAQPILPFYLLCCFIVSQAMDFPTPFFHHISDMHLLSPQREGGCLLLCFRLNPTWLLASIRERTPEKCSFSKITKYNHSWKSRSSVIQKESLSELDYTPDGDWLYFRIGGISYSVDNIQHPQAIMRITGFYLQAAHLLGQTLLLQLPSWSPGTIQTPEGFKNSPKNTRERFHGSENAAGYGLMMNKRVEKRGERMST